MKHKTMVATLAALAISAVAVGDITPDGPETDKVSAAACVALWPDGQMPDRQAEQVEPFLVWHTPRERTSDLCLIAVPGGGYAQTSTGGTVASMARRFNEKGVTVAVLRYRTPRPRGLPKHQSAWEDAQRAIRIVRGESAARGYSPDKIGMIGFSAGGHLTLMCATSATTNAYARIDAIDDVPCHLNFAIPVYPAYVLTDGARSKNTHGGNSAGMVADFLFDERTPPMCLVHGDADVYSAMGSVRVYHKLRMMGIPAELHVYAQVPHAFGADDGKVPEPPLWWDEVWLWLGKIQPKP